MPRIRSVHPEICDDEALAGVSAYADRTFVRLWTHMDDEGRVVDDARLLKARLYPLHDSMTVERVEKDLCELAQAGLLQRYEVDGKRYLSAKPKAWARWQKPRRKVPSKLPPSHPPDIVRTEHDIVGTEHAGEVDGGGEGEGDGEGVTPNNRFTRGLEHAPNPQVVDIATHVPIAERAARIGRKDPA